MVVRIKFTNGVFSLCHGLPNVVPGLAVSAWARDMSGVQVLSALPTH